MHKGIEFVQLSLPHWETTNLHGYLILFFTNKGYHCYSVSNRIYAYRGEKWLMGVRTFDITLVRAEPGSTLTGYFYLRGIWPVRFMKFSRYGYYGIAPRRQGWEMKNELYKYLGVNKDQG